MEFHKDSLAIDAAEETERICRIMRSQVRGDLKKRGAVVGISGGIDSSVVAALCAGTFGSEKVLGVMMPDTDSSPESERLAKLLADRYSFETVVENMNGGLVGLNCYQRRDEAIKSVFPEFEPGWKAKITIPSNILLKDTINFFNLTITDGNSESKTRRLPLEAYLQVVAASNLKQRLRMAALYYHAEKRNLAVVGTGNKDEHMQGFFVKYGDGGTDLKPIAHLYKTQVYQLAEHLDVPEEIQKRIPTTDTYSAEQTQEEFFFGLDFYRMDMLWYALEHDISPARAADVLKISVEQAERGYANIRRKIIATEYLRLPPLEIEQQGES